MVKKKNDEGPFVEAKFNPEAVVDYYYNANESGGKKKAMGKVAMNAKQHLIATGWKIIYGYRSNGKREMRYCAPYKKRRFLSLRSACGDFLINIAKEIANYNNVLDEEDDDLGGVVGSEVEDDNKMSSVMEDDDHDDDCVLNDLSTLEEFRVNSKKRKICDEDQRGDEGGSALVIESEVLKPFSRVYYRKRRRGSVMGEIKGSEFTRKSEVDDQRDTSDSVVDEGVLQKSSGDAVMEEDASVPHCLSLQPSVLEEFGDVDGEKMNIVDDFLKKSSVVDDNQDCEGGADKKRKVCGKGRGGAKPATTMLIESGLVDPLSKVYYINKRDGSVMGEGRITMEGIDCSCCGSVLGLTKFEAHLRSPYHFPRANMFLEDGRSLLMIFDQIRGVKKKKAKAVSSGLPKAKTVTSGLLKAKDSNDDVCLICRDVGNLVLCDLCPSSFHAHCLGLPENPTTDFWYCQSCCCGICSQSIRRGDAEDTVSIRRCEQCERQFHSECLGGYSAKESETDLWFCSESCKEVHYGLDCLIGRPIMVREDGHLTWTLLKNSDDDITDDETNKKLNLALGVMHECFKTVKEPCSGKDVGENVVFSRKSELKRLDFRGFHTVILEKNNKVVSVATVRVFGNKVAEVPLVATRFKYRRQGMCKMMMDVLEKNLSYLGVEKLVLSAIPSVLNTWTSPSFGFSKMTPYERFMLINYNFLEFGDSVTCQKLLQRTKDEDDL